MPHVHAELTGIRKTVANAGCLVLAYDTPQATQHRADGGRCHGDPQAGELTLHPPMTPEGILAGQAKDQLPLLFRYRWPAWTIVGIGRPVGNQLTVLAQQRRRGDEEAAPAFPG
jgi:hypothetical protein